MNFNINKVCLNLDIIVAIALQSTERDIQKNAVVTNKPEIHSFSN